MRQKGQCSSNDLLMAVDDPSVWIGKADGRGG
jgi:hypothetical protein